MIDEADILLRKDQENGQVRKIAVARSDEKLEPCEIKSGKENKVRRRGEKAALLDFPFFKKHFLLHGLGLPGDRDRRTFVNFTRLESSEENRGHDLKREIKETIYYFPRWMKHNLVYEIEFLLRREHPSVLLN